MKNKTKTYILLAVVIGVWGTIGYKIINGVGTETLQVTSQEFDTTFIPNRIAQVESFSIEPIERDPFLGTISNTKKKTSIGAPKKNLQEPIKNSPIITFGGLVKKQNTAYQVFVVNINNYQYLLKVGQIVDSVTLIKGNSKELVVRYKNKSQTIKRQ